MSRGGTADGTPGGTKRYTVIEAASMLGISTEAARQRVKRGTLATERDADGNVFVLLESDGTADGTRSDSDGTTDGTSVGTVDGTALIAAKDETIQALREQLAAWQEESRRKDHIIAALTERIPELEPAREEVSEPREGPASSSEETDKSKAPSEQQEPSQRRSFLRQFFGLQ